MSSEFLSIIVLAISLIAVPGAEAGGDEDDGGFRPAFNEAAGVADSSLFNLSVPSTPGVPLSVDVPLGAETIQLDLTPVSVRAGDFTVFTVQPDGTAVPIDPGPVRTLRGSIAGLTGSSVVGALYPDGLSVTISLPNGDSYQMHPVARYVPGAPAGLYALYVESDILVESPMGCYVEEDGGAPPAGGAAPQGPPEDSESADGTAEGQTCELTGPFFARLGCDTDFPFVDRYPTPAFAQIAIEESLAAMENAYAEDLNIFHELARIVLRPTLESDIYRDVSTNSSAILFAMRNEWATTQADAEADLALLFTYRTWIAGYVGAALIHSNCAPGSGYAQDSQFRNRVAAHEIGHIWGASHCDVVDFIGDTCGDQFPNECQDGSIMYHTAINNIVDGFAYCNRDEISLAMPSFVPRCVEDPTLMPPQVTSPGHGPLYNGDTLTFLYSPPLGQAAVQDIFVHNPADCMVNLSFGVLATPGMPFSAVPPVPTSVGPLATERLQIQFISDEYVGEFNGSAHLSSPDPVGLSMTFGLQADVEVGAHLPQAPMLSLPDDGATICQPLGEVFAWQQLDWSTAYVEDYTFQIARDTSFDPIAYERTGLRQTSFTPVGFSVTPPQTLYWRVVANNANGHGPSLTRSFVVDSQHNDPALVVQFDMCSQTQTLPPVSGTVVFPVSPVGTQVSVHLHNDGDVMLTLTNFSIPSWIIANLGSEERSIPPCGAFDLVFTYVAVPKYSIPYTVSFTTNDPTQPQYTLIILLGESICDPWPVTK